MLVKSKEKGFYSFAAGFLVVLTTSVCYFCAVECKKANRFQSMIHLLHNFESMDSDIVNLFGKPGAYKGKDVSEIDITDVDTNDILNCFGAFSYTCFQKKILVLMDALNSVQKINVFGGYISFVNVGRRTGPPITEEMLEARRINDPMSLANLLKQVFSNFIDTHVIRITVPVLNTRLEARGFNGHCYDFSFSDSPSSLPPPFNETKTEEAESSRKDPTCYRGDQGMVALSSAMVMKMFMLLPTLLKVIAAKALFGIIMGVVSVVLSKMAILPYLLAYTNKVSAAAPHGGYGQSYRKSAMTEGPTGAAAIGSGYPVGYYPPKVDQFDPMGPSAEQATGPTGPSGPSGFDNDVAESNHAASSNSKRRHHNHRTRKNERTRLRLRPKGSKDPEPRAKVKEEMYQFVTPTLDIVTPAKFETTTGTPLISDSPWAPAHSLTEKTRRVFLNETSES